MKRDMSTSEAGRGRGGGNRKGGGRGRGGGVLNKGKSNAAAGSAPTAMKTSLSSSKPASNNKSRGSSATEVTEDKRKSHQAPPLKDEPIKPTAATTTTTTQDQETPPVPQLASSTSQEKELEKRTVAVREAVKLLQETVENASQHAMNRKLFSENLKQARADFEQRKKSLKADLKKCTAFCKKIKAGTIYSTKPSDVRNDVNSLNLSRYVEEVVAALLESKPKVNDLPTISALCQTMHVCYEDFLPNLLPCVWSVVLQEKNASKKFPDCTPAELSKLRRLYVRLLTDFWLNGLLSSSDANKLGKQLADWSGALHNYAVQDAIATVAFGRAATFELLGIANTSLHEAIQKLQSEYQISEMFLASTNSDKDESITTNAEDVLCVVSRKLVQEGYELATKVQSLIKDQRAAPLETTQTLSQHCLKAYETLASSLVQTHQKLQKLEKRCNQDRLLSGNLPAAREQGLVDARKLTDSLLKSVEALSDSLNQPLPQLIEESEDDDGAKGTGLEVWTKDSAQGEEHLGPFDDEETRALYCDIPDLLTTIPPALLCLSEEEIQSRKAANTIKYGTSREEQEIETEEVPDVTPASEAQLEAEEELEKNGISEDEDKCENDSEKKDTPHYRLMMLLEQELPECHRREKIDEITERFCTHFGSSKKSRKRLLKTLFLVPRSRLDLLPYYSRMATTLDRIWDDIAPSLVTELEQQFHGQAKFKKNQNLESRMRTARYIAELTKFGAAPPIVALRCLHRCIEDFTGSNVEIACCLLESCGRFLYRMKHTTGRLNALMEAMLRLSKAKNLDERLQSLLLAAFYSVKPPQNGPRKKAKDYPPLETYLRNLLLVRLEPTEASISFSSKQLVRLPWDDPSYQCGALVTKIMLKACRRGRYNTVEAIAIVSQRLRSQRSAGEVFVRLVDAVLEELRWAMDNPNFRDQQRIITYVRLLGELYNTKSQVTGQLIFDQLFRFINVGHEIPDTLREASKKLTEANEENEKDVLVAKLPVYNSAGRVSQAIQEDEEMEELDLDTNVEEKAPEPVAVSTQSKYDPRVPSAKDPPSSSFRITMVCTLLEVVAKSIVTRSNIPKLKCFLTAFQRYLFTKSVLPTDVEFALLDTFDIIDSQWKSVFKLPDKRAATSNTSTSENSFPRYATWLEAHIATVAFEEFEANVEKQKRARFEALADESKPLSEIDNSSINDDDIGSLLDDDEDDSVESDEVLKVEMESSVAEEQGDGQSWASDDENNDEENEDYYSEGHSAEDDENCEEEFDEETYMRQLEEEDFERELRRVTMEALEKGKNTSRKQVADSMISGSQIVKKKSAEVYAPLAQTATTIGGGAGISFQLLKKGNKGKVEARELVVPIDTNLAMVATRKDDAKARERDEIRERVLAYEAQSAEAELDGGNVYLEQEKLQRNRNKVLSIEEIDKNFGTTGGNLHTTSLADKKSGTTALSNQTAGRGSNQIGPNMDRGRGGGSSRGRGGRGGRGGRSNTSGRVLFG